MEEFGIYTARSNYVRRFQHVANKSFDSNTLKITKRPSVCIKANGQYWLVPLSKIDPRDNDTAHAETQKTYNKHDKNNPPYAMDITDDLTNTGIKDYKSIVQYYNVIPVNDCYCRKYMDHEGKHAFVPDAFRGKIKGNLINYLQEVKEGRNTGFIKFYVEVRGKTKYHSINSYQLLDELNKNQVNNATKPASNLYQDLSNVTQSDLSGYVGKESAGVVDKEIQSDLHKIQSQQVRQVGQVEQVGLVGQVGQAQKSQNSVKQKAKTPNSAGKR